MALTLVIGTKNYSSWSLRAWLFLVESGLEFSEVRLPLFSSQWYETINQYSPAGRVTVLLDKDLAIWDSAVIYDYVLETQPGTVAWPHGKRERAVARSLCAEMHSGFNGIRSQLPQNIRARRSPPPLSQNTLAEIARVEAMWADCRNRYGGPWLFGEFSLADVVYAPVALRFVTYGITLKPAAQAFVAAIQELPSIQRWATASAAESERLAVVDDL